jgi:hypothetical protein
MYGASIATARSRFGGASTVKPWLWSSDATAFQLDASAHAPWTRTMVGFGTELSSRSFQGRQGRRRLPAAAGSRSADADDGPTGEFFDDAGTVPW